LNRLVDLRITALLRHTILFFEGKDKVKRLWSRKGNSIKKWRSKAWSIDLHKTKLTIVVKNAKFSQHISPWI